MSTPIKVPIEHPELITMRQRTISRNSEFTRIRHPDIPEDQPLSDLYEEDIDFAENGKDFTKL